MAKLDTLTLRVTDPDAQRQFYRDALGMSDQGGDRLGYTPEETALRFVKAEAAYRPQPADLYWKIAIAVPDIDLAYTQLQKAGVPCTAPSQFRDVGYLAKAVGPEGFTIELIDHWFKGDRPDFQRKVHLFGGGAHLNLLTLRTADMAAVEPNILSWGMKPVSIQPVDPYGFTLYFYGFTDETPPNSDLTAVENRIWLYQRPYTILEVQHIHELDAVTSPSKQAGGYGGATIKSSDLVVPCPQLMISKAAG